MSRTILTAALLGMGLTAWAQQEQQGGAPGGVPGGAGPGGIPGGANVPSNTPGNLPGRGRPGIDPTDPRQQQQRFPEMGRPPIFLSGKVVLEDGTPPPESVVIERVCNGTPRPEAYTDSKGRFSFQLGQNQHVFADASVGNSSDPLDQQGGFGGGGRNPGSGGFGGMGPAGGRQISERDLMGCDLRASLPGYRSEVVSLAGRRAMDNPDVGTIILRRLAGVEGFSTSMTTLQAPKDAKKAYDKGRDLAKKKKMDDAQKEFEKAVSLYPNYAVAWFALGELRRMGNKNDEARQAYEKAIEADRKFVNPYMPLAQLAAGENKWQDVADISARLLKLNPIEYPMAYFFHSVASYNMQKFDAAEKSAREAVKLDTQHRIPKAQHLLGVLLAMRDDYSGAVENIRGYLQFAPGALDADQARQQLADFEKRLQATATTQKPQ